MVVRFVRLCLTDEAIDLFVRVVVVDPHHCLHLRTEQGDPFTPPLRFSAARDGEWHRCVDRHGILINLNLVENVVLPMFRNAVQQPIFVIDEVDDGAHSLKNVGLAVTNGPFRDLNATRRTDRARRIGVAIEVFFAREPALKGNEHEADGIVWLFDQFSVEGKGLASWVSLKDGSTPRGNKTALLLTLDHPLHSQANRIGVVDCVEVQKGRKAFGQIGVPYMIQSSLTIVLKGGSDCLHHRKESEIEYKKER